MRSLIMSLCTLTCITQTASAVTVNNDPAAAAAAAAAFDAAKNAEARGNQNAQDKFMVAVLNVATEKFAEGIASLYKDKLESVTVTPSIPPTDSPADISSVGYATMDGRTCKIEIRMSQLVLPLKASASCVQVDGTDATVLEGGSPAFTGKLIQSIFIGMRTGHINPEDFSIDIKR